MLPVLGEVSKVKGRRIEHVPWNRGHDDFSTDFATKDRQSVRPIVHAEAWKVGWATGVEAIETMT